MEVAVSFLLCVVSIALNYSKAIYIDNTLSGCVNVRSQDLTPESLWTQDNNNRQDRSTIWKDLIKQKVCVAKRKCERRSGRCIRRAENCEGRIVENACKRTKGSTCTCCVNDDPTTEEPTTTEIPTTVEMTTLPETTTVTDNPACSARKLCPLVGGYCIEKNEPCEGKQYGKACRARKQGKGVRCACCIPPRL